MEVCQPHPLVTEPSDERFATTKLRRGENAPRWNASLPAATSGVLVTLNARRRTGNEAWLVASVAGSAWRLPSLDVAPRRARPGA